MAVILLAISFVVNTAVARPGLAQLTTSCSAYKSIPLPAEAEAAIVPRTAPACASYRSYRGIGRPRNYVTARACAWQERLADEAGLGQNPKEPTAEFVGGSLILADLYFNGAGVKRDIPLALRFACEKDEEMVELALPDIAKRNAAGHVGKDFEFCDYGFSTIEISFCAGYQSQIGDEQRNRYYRSLKSSMTPAQQLAFQELLAAEHGYIEAHASEVDQGGTIRAIRTIGSTAILEDLFHTEVVHFERQRWPRYTKGQIKSADAELDHEYQQKRNRLRAQSQEDIFAGAVTTEQLYRVEIAWEKYRDAWVAFAKLRYPAEVAAIRAAIVLDRYRLIKTIPVYE